MDEAERLAQRLELLSAALEEATDDAERRALRQELLDVHRRLDAVAGQGQADGEPAASPAPPEAAPAEVARVDRPVSKLAATGLALGLASIFLYEFGLVPLAAVAISGVGLWRLRPDRESGLWMAIVGVILGAIYTVAYLAAAGHVQL